MRLQISKHPPRYAMLAAAFVAAVHIAAFLMARFLMPHGGFLQMLVPCYLLINYVCVYISKCVVADGLVLALSLGDHRKAWIPLYMDYLLGKAVDAISTQDVKKENLNEVESVSITFEKVFPYRIRFLLHTVLKWTGFVIMISIAACSGIESTQFSTTAWITLFAFMLSSVDGNFAVSSLKSWSPDEYSIGTAVIWNTEKFEESGEFDVLSTDNR